MTTSRIRVFVVDDHELVRRGIDEALDAEPDIALVGQAGTAQDAVRRIAATRPDIVLLDLSLPDGSGVDVCDTLRLEVPHVRCLMLTAEPGAHSLQDAVRAGAAGYVLKGGTVDELLRAIRAVAAGGSWLDPRTAPSVLSLVRSGGPDERLAHLSKQERTLLSLIAEGLTNRQIAERMHLAEKTVRNYVSRLLRKLGMERRAQAAAFVAGLKDPPRQL